MISPCNMNFSKFVNGNLVEIQGVAFFPLFPGQIGIWKLLIFVEGGKLEFPDKNPRSRDENQQQTQPTYDAEYDQELNPGRIVGRQVLSPLHHSCFPLIQTSSCVRNNVLYLNCDLRVGILAQQVLPPPLLLKESLKIFFSLGINFCKAVFLN